MGVFFLENLMSLFLACLCTHVRTTDGVEDGNCSLTFQYDKQETVKDKIVRLLVIRYKEVQLMFL